MDNQATELPLQEKMEYSEQLAVMLMFQGCVKSGIPYVDIAKRLRHREVFETRRLAWDQFIAQLDLAKNFGVTLAETGLFSSDVKKILAVVNEAEHALAAVIEYLSIVVNRKSSIW
jgi:hypothetical protein